MRPEQIALQYIGETEKPGNAGFNNTAFEAKMRAVGFEKKHAWCSYFAELVFKEAFPEKLAELDKLFSASAVQTYKNFKDAGYALGELPRVGSLVIWQLQKQGKATWQGHAGIVISVLGASQFESVEGNTNDGGGREGYIVARKTRKVAKVKDGLQVLGFIHI